LDNNTLYSLSANSWYTPHIIFQTSGLKICYSHISLTHIHMVGFGDLINIIMWFPLGVDKYLIPTCGIEAV